MLATRAQALELSIVFSQSSARRRHRPSARQHLKAFGRVGSLDDLNGPVTLPLEGVAQFAARIASIGEDVAQPWKPVADGLEQRRCSVSILHIGRMNKDKEHQPECVSDDVALAPVDL